MPGASAHLHRDAKALVERAQAAAPVAFEDAVEEAVELAIAAIAAEVGGQPRPRKVQRIHDQQGTRTCQPTCARMTQPTDRLVDAVGHRSTFHP